MQKGRERNFGPSVGFHASAMLIEMLRRKAENCWRWGYRVCNDEYQTVPILPYLWRIPQKNIIATSAYPLWTEHSTGCLFGFFGTQCERQCLGCAIGQCSRETVTASVGSWESNSQPVQDGIGIFRKQTWKNLILVSTAFTN